jgi:hypothetical protein
MNSQSWKVLLIAASMLFLSSCREQTTHAENRVASSQLPTTTEVFNLRSKCQALGEKIMEDNIIGNALAQEQLSHYDPETNHCYVKLDVHTADLMNTPRDKYSDEVFLFDGQTKEMLASTRSTGNDKWASILSDSLAKYVRDSSLPSYDETQQLIDKFMAEDRRP